MAMVQIPARLPVQIELAKRHFAPFVELTTAEGFELEAWQRLICDRLEMLEHQSGQRILFHGPPQFGKSILVSQRFPAWIIGKCPDTRVRLASYNETHSGEFSKANLNIMRDDIYRRIFPHPDCRVPNQCPSDMWSTALRASRNDSQASFKALGLHSGFTGQGVDHLLVDDPYKNRQEAFSDTIRDSIWGWWTDVANVRLNPATNVVVMFHRWHQDDLAGRLIEQGGWEVIRLPAIADGGDDDPTIAAGIRQVGESLSRRYSIPFLESIKKTSGETTFNALFQGRPILDGGNMIKTSAWRRWNYNCIPDAFDAIIQSWDTATSEKTSADYTVGSVWGRKGANVFLLDVCRGQWDSPTVMAKIDEMTKRWPSAHTKLVEHTLHGMAVIQMMQDKIAGIIPVRPEGDKTSRVNAALPLIESGNVYIPEESLFPWVTVFTDECAAFPNGKHDDQVDSMTQAIIRLSPAMQGAQRDAVPVDPGLEAFRQIMKEKNSKHQQRTGW